MVSNRLLAASPEKMRPIFALLTGGDARAAIQLRNRNGKDLEASAV